MKTFHHGKYHVSMGLDGAIQVQHGDWLSKYSAAIHNDFWHIYEYGRKNHQGAIAPLADVNLIRTGETLFHLPTYHAAHRSTTAPPHPPHLSDAAKKKIILETLGRDYHLHGDRLHWLSKAIDIVGYADNAATLANLAGLIAEGTAAVAVADSIAILNIFLTPLGLFITFVNAWETGERLYGFQAVAYTTTAWAFDDPIPTGSRQTLKNIAQMFPKDIPNYEKAWKEASDSALAFLAKEPTTHHVSKQAFQLLLRLAGDNRRQTLCLNLLKGFESKVDHVALTAWRSGYALEYPN